MLGRKDYHAQVHALHALHALQPLQPLHRTKSCRPIRHKLSLNLNSTVLSFICDLAFPPITDKNVYRHFPISGNGGICFSFAFLVMLAKRKILNSLDMWCVHAAYMLGGACARS